MTTFVESFVILCDCNLKIKIIGIQFSNLKMNKKVSVCMATYNGAKYLRKQIESILSELSDNDELVVVDDSSSDSTIDILKSFKDKRISIFINEKNRGVNYSFEKSIMLSCGEYVFLADQDDIWVPGRIVLMLNELCSADMVASNFSFIDSADEEIIERSYVPLQSQDSLSHVSNLFGIFLGRRNYYGCAMAFKRSIVPLLLPIPDYIESHDLWFASVANFLGSISHLESVTLKRRIHGQNVSVVQRPLIKKIISRLLFIKSFHEVEFRLKRRVKE